MALFLRRFGGAMAALCLGYTTAATPHPHLHSGAAPRWIDKPLPFLAKPLPANESSPGGVAYLSLDYQVDVASRATFVQTALQVTDPSGLQVAAEVSLTFDPAYEHLTLHHVRVIRGGATQDRLGLGAFEILRQERDRDRALYDGRLTALLQLNDIRVGDIVEFAYTRAGSNPVFGSNFFRFIPLGWGAPIRNFRYRLIEPQKRRITFQAIGPQGVEMRRSEDTDRREYRWEASPLPGLQTDEFLPAWHVAYPMVQASEFTTWREVVGWALPLYTNPAHSHDEI